MGYGVVYYILRHRGNGSVYGGGDEWEKVCGGRRKEVWWWGGALLHEDVTISCMQYLCVQCYQSRARNVKIYRN